MYIYRTNTLQNSLLQFGETERPVENEFSVVFAFSDPPGRIHPIMRIRNAVFGAWLFLLVAVVILRQVQTVYTHTLGTTNEKL